MLYTNNKPTVETLSGTNPFRGTKATDLSDSEINETFVSSSRILDRINPSQRMPVLLTGGKGSGRTHLLRYWSLPVQLLRHAERPADTFQSTGYLGQYVLLGGMDAGRFSVSALPDEVVGIAFGYYFDLGVCSALLRSISLLGELNIVTASETQEYCRRLLSLVGVRSRKAAPGPGDVLSSIGKIRRRIDFEVNNAALDLRRPVFRIGNSPGEVFYGAALLARECFACLDGVVICYLLDELENLDEAQQRYVQTLVRERREGVSLILGGRTYGVKSFETLAAREVNRPGAEFEVLALDDFMRTQNRQDFRSFCAEVVTRRLELAGIALSGDPEQYFVSVAQLPTRSTRRAFATLRRTLTRFGGPNGTLDSDQVEAILRSLARAQNPIMEKAAILALYQDWNAGIELLDSAKSLALNGDETNERLARLLRHFRSDLEAQIRREMGGRPLYIGFETLTVLADGNMRNFMNIMKAVHSWCEFSGEKPWFEIPISVASQQRAVLDAADWFFGDSQVVGEFGDSVRQGMERLGELLSSIRFSPKPSESSACAFNIDDSRLEARTRSVLDAAAKYSLLVERPARRGRNEDRRVRTLQINRMLAPRWDLPIGRRGVIDLSAREIESIFGTVDRDSFRKVLADRLARLAPPFRNHGDATLF